MKNLSRHMILLGVLGMMLLMPFNANLSAIIYFNGVEQTFDIKAINEDIIEGAGRFLKSYSNFLMVLHKAELAELKGWDFSKIQKYNDSAINNIQKAIDIYSKLNERIKNKQCRSTVIVILAKFDYENFQKKNSLLKPIFDEVSAYLSKGEISQLCSTMLSNSNNILNVLRLFQKKIKSSVTLNKSELWALNEYYSRSLLFGQYVARVFEEIK